MPNWIFAWWTRRFHPEDCLCCSGKVLIEAGFVVLSTHISKLPGKPLLHSFFLLEPQEMHHQGSRRSSRFHRHKQSMCPFHLQALFELSLEYLWEYFTKEGNRIFTLSLLGKPEYCRLKYLSQSSSSANLTVRALISVAAMGGESLHYLSVSFNVSKQASARFTLVSTSGSFSSKAVTVLRVSTS